MTDQPLRSAYFSAASISLLGCLATVLSILADASKVRMVLTAFMKLVPHQPVPLRVDGKVVAQLI
jgi:hypothetical protein